jgi:glycosidase
MPVWSRHPTIFEINTWVWLSELSRRLRKPLDLASVPAEEWDSIAELGFDAVWLMGVWERSPAGIAMANQNPDLLESFRKALPDFRTTDNVGSPYCVRQYKVDPALGGSKGLDGARNELAKRGIHLILDFVPNHVAADHPWVIEHPEYFLHGTADDLGRDPEAFMAREGRVFACGRDPYFPPWPDVLQLNAFHPELRRAAVETISGIAQQCDGIRCDMAMLVLSQVFERTWGSRAGAKPSTEYWPSIIHAIKTVHPGFLFIAEAYWDLEWELQQQGFDFCYDKRLYDRLMYGNAESVRLHLCADSAYQSKLVRFIENHDEPRAAASFSPARERAAAVTMATVPGARLFQEGQLEGRKIKLPVFLGRRPEEAADTSLKDFYRKLLRTVRDPMFREGEWSRCEQTGWPDNPSFQDLVAWSWRRADGRIVIVVNLSDRVVQARLRMPWDDLTGDTWCLYDTLSGASFERNGDEMQSAGLYVELGPWDFHFLRFSRTKYDTVARAA